MANPVLFRKRLIPLECVELKDDVILQCDDSIIVTRWNALRPKKHLHHGYSCYYMKEGFKVSKFYAQDNTLLYYYCDIITRNYDEKSNHLTFTDLLADVIIYPDGFVKVVDIDEMVEALDHELVTPGDIKKALLSLDKLLKIIYSGKLDRLTAPIDRFEREESTAQNQTDG